MIRGFRLVRDRTTSLELGPTYTVGVGVVWSDEAVTVRRFGLEPLHAYWPTLTAANAEWSRTGVRAEWGEDGERNRLARQLADLRDERDTAVAAAADAEAAQGRMERERDVAATWLASVAGSPCDVASRPTGSCTRDPELVGPVDDVAARWCNPCRAWCGLHALDATDILIPTPTGDAGAGL